MKFMIYFSCFENTKCMLFKNECILWSKFFLFLKIWSLNLEYHIFLLSKFYWILFMSQIWFSSFAYLILRVYSILPLSKTRIDWFAWNFLKKLVDSVLVHSGQCTMRMVKEWIHWYISFCPHVCLVKLQYFHSTPL